MVEFDDCLDGAVGVFRIGAVNDDKVDWQFCAAVICWDDGVEVFGGSNVGPGGNWGVAFLDLDSTSGSKSLNIDFARVCWCDLFCLKRQRVYTVGLDTLPLAFSLLLFDDMADGESMMVSWV